MDLENNFRGSCKKLLFNLKSELIFDKIIFKATQKYEFEQAITNLTSGFYNLIIQQGDGVIYNEKINIVR